MIKEIPLKSNNTISIPMLMDSAKNAENSDAIEMPWHRFGTKLNRPATAKEAICNAGLDHTVSKKQLYVGEERHPWPGFYALMRQDAPNSTEPVFLRYVQANFIPLQNTNAFSFFDPVVATGAAFYESAGALRIVGAWLTVRLRGDLEILPGDGIACFLLLKGGLGTIEIGSMPVRLISKAILGFGFFPDSSLPIVRSLDGQPQLADSPEKALQTLQQHFEKLATQFRTLLKVEMNEERLEKYLQAAFSAPLPKENETRRFVIQAVQDRKECARLFTEGRGNQLPGVRGTLWAAFNAVAEYMDFHQTKPRSTNYIFPGIAPRHTALMAALRMAEEL